MILPILHLEKQVQIKDLTRFDASKSILVKGSAGSITAVKITANATEIDVFNANSKNWFLDFAFTAYAFDVDSTNYRIDFEANGQKYSTNVAAGTYTLADLLTAVKTAIEAIASPVTITTTVDSFNRITFAPSQSLKFLPNETSKGLLRHIGIKEDGQLVSFPVEYGLRKVSLKVSTSTEDATITEYVEVYTPEGDSLFSEDADLIAEENDIMKWLPVGHGSFIYLHRKAQKSILDFMDRNGYRDDKGRKFTKFAFVDRSDVKEWSTYEALVFFFGSAQNQTDDVFKDKRKHYEKLQIAARDRIALSLDTKGDGKAEKNQGPDIRTGRLVMR